MGEWLDGWVDGWCMDGWIEGGSILPTSDSLLIFLGRISHFDYVKVEDLEKIGMGKPAIRRLMETVKRKKPKKSILDKVTLSL